MTKGTVVSGVRVISVRIDTICISFAMIRPASLKLIFIQKPIQSRTARNNVLFESYLLPPNAADMRCCLWWCGKNVHVYAFFRSRGRVHGIDEFCPQRSPVASRSDEGEVSSRAKYGSNKLTKGYQGILVGIALQLRWQY